MNIEKEREESEDSRYRCKSDRKSKNTQAMNTLPARMIIINRFSNSHYSERENQTICKRALTV